MSSKKIFCVECERNNSELSDSGKTTMDTYRDHLAKEHNIEIKPKKILEFSNEEGK